jgi:drug/metabolite transporter (DMT)-like permease
MHTSSKGHGVDALLLLMTIIWGTNFVIIKTAFRELEPQAFNAMRMIVGSVAFLVVLAGVRPFARRVERRPDGEHRFISIFHTPARVTPREWLGLAALGVVGHALYQFFFIGGLARTSVANSSLVLAMTPVVITILSATLGHDRVGRSHWLGAATSLLGIYLVVGRGVELGGVSLIGDLMVFGAVCCWAAYTLGSRPLMARHSPVAVNGLSMALGTALYLPLLWPPLSAVDWRTVSPLTMALIVYSALFALCVAYTIWYIGVRELGSARTSAYSNFIPIVAMISAAIFLNEPIGWRKLLGGAAVLAGVALTRAGRSARVPSATASSSI